jgi:hypothetical protein
MAKEMTIEAGQKMKRAYVGMEFLLWGWPSVPHHVGNEYKSEQLAV